MANMIFRRGTHSEVNNMPVQDGQLLFDTTNREILMDNGSQRQRYGGNVTIDSALSDTSENPVQNKVVKGALDDKLEASDVIDDLSTAVAVTENGVPVGCKAVAELNENLIAKTTWQYVGHASDSNTVSLPSTWKELYCVVTRQNGDHPLGASCSFLRRMFSDIAELVMLRSELGTMYPTNSWIGYTIGASETEAQILDANADNRDIKSSCTLHVWYKP